MRDTTKRAIEELRKTPTDLARLLDRTLCMEQPCALVSSVAVARWRREAPLAWAEARRLLRAEGAEIIIV
jgi:hypothetical protein